MQAESRPAPTPLPETDLEQGLTAQAAAERLTRYGPNAIQEVRVSGLRKLLSLLWGPIPWMIEIALVLSGAAKHWVDFAIILAMLVVNATVSFWQEHKADSAIEALKERLALTARVLRDGQWRDVPARELVPGDVVRIKLGNIVPADLQLAAGDYLSIDQSALTGESLPVDKNVGDVAYSGSVVRLGEMTGRVTATGMETYFGRTARLVETAGAVSHFQQAVLKIGNFLILATLGLVVLILTVELFHHAPLVDTLLFALILTVAAIPVALPAVLSVTMAVGASVLARMQAIVSRLVSIEEMAGMDVLCSDKTGTLTQNRLALGEPALFAAADGDALLRAAALTCEHEAPDAMDQAVLQAAPAGLTQDDRVVGFQPFDPVRKRAEAEVQRGEARFRVAKGAPQVILTLVEADAALHERVEHEVNAFAAKGFRTLGVAQTEPGGDWQFLGLLPFFDPPREDSAATIAAARRMGLRIIMVTGDHLAIAREMAGQLNLGPNVRTAEEVLGGATAAPGSPQWTTPMETLDGVAQVFPEHKYNIVQALQGAGHIVGMTGDGVNDAPALKQADVGIAVSGAADAARAAADIVLTAPGLSVIISAVEEARRIFERMTAYAAYRIAETVRVLLFMTLSILVFRFYPVTAVMIVLLAILNDFPIMMIAYDNAPVAARPVRWDMHRVLSIGVVLGIAGVMASFGLFWIAEEYLHLPQPTIQTLIFLKLLVAGHLTIYITRNAGSLWKRPWPSWRLLVTTEATQVLGTLAAVYGWFVTPIGWGYALAVWGYALAWMLVNDVVKVATYRLLRTGLAGHARHMERVHVSLHRG
ncbi:MAG TPA: plasma-membrane proton-efflux P-type ATPase [bacterium]|nr:plasma-membrane proton-efflux P-type ATPase [bacterium]